jgi:hypothetical protein
MARDVYRRVLSPSVATGPAGLVRLGAIVLLLTLALALAGGARALDSPPAITLGSIAVVDGNAVVTGTVDVDANVDADLTVNGSAVQVDASGNFSANVDLNGRPLLVISLGGLPDETIILSIPLDVAIRLGGDHVLDALVGAEISIDVPEKGFQIVDGQMPTVSGEVLREDNLGSLTINGRDALRSLRSDGTFSLQPPAAGSEEQVIVRATDKNGVSQTSAFSLTRVRSAIRTRAGTSVSAAGAQGIVIAKVRIGKRDLESKKRLAVLVRVKDKRAFLVRGAAVRLTTAPSRYLVGGASARVGFTNRLGQARFAVRLERGALTGRTCRHLAISVRASTPTASARKKMSLRLPTLLHR